MKSIDEYYQINRNNIQLNHEITLIPLNQKNLPQQKYFYRLFQYCCYFQVLPFNVSKYLLVIPFIESRDILIFCMKSICVQL